MALEFAVLLLTLAYVPTFALHDLRRLLARGEPASEPAMPSGSLIGLSIGSLSTMGGGSMLGEGPLLAGGLAGGETVVPLRAKVEPIEPAV